MLDGLARPHFSTGCAFATAGILVFGFAAPSIEASGVWSEVRVVQLASLTAPAANPLGVLVGTLPAPAEAHVSHVSHVIQPASGGPADVPAAVEAAADPQAAVAEPLATAGAVGGVIWFSIADLVLTPLMWVLQVLPPPLQQLAYFFYFPVAVAVNVVGLIAGITVDFVLGLFGIGLSSAVGLTAEAVDSGGEMVTSNPVEDGADQLSREPAKAVELESVGGTESVAASAVPAEPEAAVVEQVPADATEAVEATEAPDAVDVEPAVAEEVEQASTEPEPAVQDEVATDATEAESVTAQGESTTVDRDSVAGADTASGNTAAAEGSSPASDSKGSDSSGDTAGS